MTLLRFDRRDHELVHEFEAFVEAKPYPCVGAKAAIGNYGSSYFIARDIRSSWDDIGIHRSLCGFVTRAADSGLRSHIVLFHKAEGLNEAEFETALWERLSSISQKDQWMGYPHDDQISADPDDDNFGISVGGAAFFVLGLHPQASRSARRFPRPALVFNLHEQFRTLKADGRYAKMCETIRTRDRAFSGSVNPMLSDHGEISEARQYSGRAVGEDWRCPFSREVADARKAA